MTDRILHALIAEDVSISNINIELDSDLGLSIRVYDELIALNAEIDEIYASYKTLERRFISIRHWRDKQTTDKKTNRAPPENVIMETQVKVA